MKLYTEEQVRKAHQNGRHGGHNENWYTTDDYIDSLTPIELPSEFEIDDKIEDSSYSLEFDAGFKFGVEWLINHIKQQVIS